MISDLEVTEVAINPIIMAPSTDYCTIYTTVLRVQEVTRELGFQKCPVFCDMGLLTKALEIVGAKPDVLPDVIPCDGRIHLALALFSGIGFLYSGAGLNNISF